MFMHNIICPDSPAKPPGSLHLVQCQKTPNPNMVGILFWLFAYQHATKPDKEQMTEMFFRTMLVQPLNYFNTALQLT